MSSLFCCQAFKMDGRLRAGVLGSQVRLEVRLKDAELSNGPLIAVPFAFHKPRRCCGSLV